MINRLFVPRRIFWYWPFSLWFLHCVKWMLTLLIFFFYVLMLALVSSFSSAAHYVFCFAYVCIFAVRNCIRRGGWGFTGVKRVCCPHPHHTSPYSVCFLLTVPRHSCDAVLRRSKAVAPVLVLLFVVLWFILRGDLFYALPCVILFLCFSVLLALRLPGLRKRES